MDLGGVRSLGPAMPENSARRRPCSSWGVRSPMATTTAAVSFSFCRPRGLLKTIRTDAVPAARLDSYRYYDCYLKRSTYPKEM